MNLSPKGINTILRSKILTANLVTLLPSFLHPELKPQPEVDPAEVLEFEHGLEVVAPDGGSEAEVDGAGVEFGDEVQPVQDTLVLQPHGLPVDAHAGGVEGVVLAAVEDVAGMGAQRAPGGLEVLGHHHEVAVEVAVALGHVGLEVFVSAGAGGRVGHADHEGRQPAHAEVAFAQQGDAAGEVAVLVAKDLLAVGLVGTGVPFAVEDGADVAELYALPEGHIETVLEGVVAPAALGQGILVEVVVRDHDRAVRLHVGRGHLQEAGAAVGKLGPGRRHRQQQGRAGHEATSQYVGSRRFQIFISWSKILTTSF